MSAEHEGSTCVGRQKVACRTVFSFRRSITFSNPKYSTKLEKKTRKSLHFAYGRTPFFPYIETCVDHILMGRQWLGKRSSGYNFKG